MRYCIAVLPHAGLGNRLLPWARCRIFAHVNDVPMLATRWAQTKIGPLLRRERDPRIYHNLFVRPAHEIDGWRRLRLLLVVRRHPEPEPFALISPRSPSDRPELIIFQGQKDYFARLNGWHEFLLRELRAITHTRWLREAESVRDVPIGIHVRAGDVPAPPTGTTLSDLSTGVYRTPVSWFVRSLRAVRSELGFPARAFVVTDGTDQEIADLLAMDGVFRAREGSAISGILMLAQAKVLIASGGSTFGGWAAFLGQMPTILRPGHFWHWFELENRHGQYLGEFDPAAPSLLFIEQLRDLGRALRRYG